MGCWDETCAITTLPIMHGTDCVMAVFEREQQSKWLLREVFPTKMHLRHMVGIYKGRYNYYGWMDGVDKPEDVGDKKKDSRVNLIDYPRAFVLKEAWDWAVKDVERDDFLMSFIEREIKMDKDAREAAVDKICPSLFMSEAFPDNIDKDIVIEYMKVYQTCYSLRRGMYSGVQYSGCQHNDMEPYEGLIALTQRLVTKHRNVIDNW